MCFQPILKLFLPHIVYTVQSILDIVYSTMWFIIYIQHLLETGSLLCFIKWTQSIICSSWGKFDDFWYYTVNKISLHLITAETSQDNPGVVSGQVSNCPQMAQSKARLEPHRASVEKTSINQSLIFNEFAEFLKSCFRIIILSCLLYTDG